MKLAKESAFIAVIGLADLVTTVVWVEYHGAAEANPIFSHYLDKGIFWFALMKLVMLAAPLVVLEWARHRRPRFTLCASRFAIGAYCCLYVAGLLHVNPNLLRPQSADAAIYPKASYSRIRPFHRHGQNRSEYVQAGLKKLQERLTHGRSGTRGTQIVASSL